MPRIRPYRCYYCVDKLTKYVLIELNCIYFIIITCNIIVYHYNILYVCNVYLVYVYMDADRDTDREPLCCYPECPTVVGSPVTNCH